MDFRINNIECKCYLKERYRQIVLWSILIQVIVLPSHSRTAKFAIDCDSTILRAFINLSTKFSLNSHIKKTTNAFGNFCILYAESNANNIQISMNWKRVKEMQNWCDFFPHFCWFYLCIFCLILITSFRLMCHPCFDRCTTVFTQKRTIYSDRAK